MEERKMKNSKSTKKALLASVLSLLLCFTMLIGTTFAWFTDTVTSANNVIMSGNLDIEFEYWDGDSWEDVKGKSDILTNTLWEPGAAEVAYLRVKNAGSLALKYRLGINIVSETAGVNVNDESFKLSDYILFGVVEDVNGGTDPYADRRDAVDAVVGAKKISAGYTKASAMLENEELYLALVVYMPEEVDNVANYKTSEDVNDPDKYRPRIELGLTVTATQYSYEQDSFGQYYDGGATWLGGVDTSWYNTVDTEFVIGTPEQLAGLAAITNGYADVSDDFDGKTIKLASNLDLNDLDWTPIADPMSESDAYTGFAGTFDGCGHTIYNLNIDRPNAWGQGLFGYNEDPDVVITNLNIHNVNVVANDYAGVGAVAGYFTHGSFSNIKVSGDINILCDSSYGYAGGIIGRGYNVNFENCAVIGNSGSTITSAGSFVGGIAGYQCNNAKTFKDCTVEGVTITGYSAVGGISGLIQTGGKAIDNCTVKNVVLNMNRVDGNPYIGALVGCYSGTAHTVLTGTVENVTLNGCHIPNAVYGELYGNEYDGGQVTPDFDVTGVTGTVNNKLVEVTLSGNNGIAEGENGVKYIYNANGLKSLSGTKISGKYVLMADVDMGGAEFKAMSVYYTSATFDGNGHTVSNVKVVSGDFDNTTEQASIFYVSTNGSLTVSDLLLKNVTVTTKNIDNGYGAAVVGYCEGALVLNNVDVVNANVTASKSSGMLVGHLTPTGSLVATGCEVSGFITITDFEANGHYAGSYVGTIAGNTTLTDCTADVRYGGNIHANNVGTVYGRRVSGTVTVDGVTVA